MPESNNLQILKEFERLEPSTTAKDLEELCSLGLQKYRSAMISLLKAKKKNDFINDVETTAAHY